MPRIEKEKKIIEDYLADPSLCNFIISNLQKSLRGIALSEALVDDLTKNLTKLELPLFHKKFGAELKTGYSEGFFQKIVPTYLNQYIVPEIPTGGKFLDIGCGSGILLRQLWEKGGFSQLSGIDINSYPEWPSLKETNIALRVVTEKDFPKFISRYSPDSIALTWVLHHMDFSLQEKYLKEIFSNMKHGSLLVILEDAYAENLQPENGQILWQSFQKLNPEKRKKVMAVYDWVANVVLEKREEIPMPFSYRTLEEWVKLGQSIGFSVHSKKFIGFPEKRDINTPQSLLVLKK